MNQIRLIKIAAVIVILALFMAGCATKQGGNQEDATPDIVPQVAISTEEPVPTESPTDPPEATEAVTDEPTPTQQVTATPEVITEAPTKPAPTQAAISGTIEVPDVPIFVELPPDFIAMRNHDMGLDEIIAYYDIAYQGNSELDNIAYQAAISFRTHETEQVADAFCMPGYIGCGPTRSTNAESFEAMQEAIAQQAAFFEEYTLAPLGSNTYYIATHLHDTSDFFYSRSYVTFINQVKVHIGILIDTPEDYAQADNLVRNLHVRSSGENVSAVHPPQIEMQLGQPVTLQWLQRARTPDGALNISVYGISPSGIALQILNGANPAQVLIMRLAEDDGESTRRVTDFAIYEEFNQPHDVESIEQEAEDGVVTIGGYRITVMAIEPTPNPLLLHANANLRNVVTLVIDRE